MVYKFDGYNWLVRLEKGELLVENLLKLAKQENIAGAWLSGIGAAQWSEIGVYNVQSKDYKWQKFDQLMEITSLEGNVAWEGDEPFLHIHVNLTDPDMRAYGGHLKEFQVGATCEVLLHRWYADNLTRRHDPDTGLKLLDF